MEKIRGFEIAKGFEDKNINLPERKTKASAAYDIEAAEDTISPAFKPGMKPTLIKTGLKAYMQEDEVLLIVPRSSGPKKQGILFPHSTGVIDADYYENIDNDGHIIVAIRNVSESDKKICKGDRICQGIFMKYLTVSDEVSIEKKRLGGFGSTNKL